LDEDDEDDEDDKDDKDDEEDEEDEEERRRRRRQEAGRGRRRQEATDIKSNNPHLAGGEKHITSWICLKIGYPTIFTIFTIIFPMTISGDIYIYI